MSYTPLPKSEDGKAVLVEQNKPVAIDDSTPIEVNVQQPVDVEVISPVEIGNIPGDFPDAGSLSESKDMKLLILDMIFEQELTNRYLREIHGEDLRLDIETEK